MGKDIAVVLVSGGMDSCVTAAMVVREYEPAFLHVNYGQRTERRELQAFHAIAERYQVGRRMVITLEHLAQIGGSSLTDPALPVSPARLDATGIPTSYVPFRNANLLAAAVSWAEVLGARAVFIGAVEEDTSGYPDCRREFYDAFNVLIERGTRPDARITVHTPVIHMTKELIVRTGIDLGAPLDLTWSCYKNDDVACGQCDSCALRLRAFQRAGVEDPLPYVQRPSYV